MELQTTPDRRRLPTSHICVITARQARGAFRDDDEGWSGHVVRISDDSADAAARRAIQPSPREGSTSPPLVVEAINISRSALAPYLQFGGHPSSAGSSATGSSNPLRLQGLGLCPSAPLYPPAATRDADEGWSGHIVRILDDSVDAAAGRAIQPSPREGSTSPPLVVEVINISRSALAPFLQFGGHPSSAGSSAASSSSPLRQQGVGLSSSAPLDHPAATRDADEGWSGLDASLFGYSGAAMGGLIAQSNGVINAWGTATKVAFVIAVCMALASLGIGVLTAGYRGIPMSRRGRLSTFCARFSTVLFTALLMMATSCQFGRSACVVGVSSATVAVSLMTALWAFEGRSSAAQAVSSFWGRLCRR